MNRVIWLKTARVYATDSDMTAKVERTTIKLEDGDNWNKFIRYAPLKGYKKDEPPYVEKVMEKKNGLWVDVDPKQWVDQLNEVLAIKPMANEKIDFKALAERQANELKETKAGLKAMEERLKALETPNAVTKPEADTPTEKVIEPLQAVEMTSEKVNPVLIPVKPKAKRK